MAEGIVFCGVYVLRMMTLCFRLYIGMPLALSVRLVKPYLGVLKHPVAISDIQKVNDVAVCHR